MAVTEKDVRNALKTVKDPELHLDLVVLGLVYDIAIEDAKVHATISLTSPFCPVAPQIVELRGVRHADQPQPSLEEARLHRTDPREPVGPQRAEHAQLAGRGVAAGEDRGDPRCDRGELGPGRHGPRA